MIKTQHVRLGVAAERLGVDPDTLLIFAAEGGVQLYALLNDWRYVTPSRVEKNEKNSPLEALTNPEVLDVIPVKKYFTFIRVGYYYASSVLKSGETIWEGGICTDPDEEGVYWETESPTQQALEMMRDSNPKRFKFAKKVSDDGKAREPRRPEDEFEAFATEPLPLRRDNFFVKTSDIERLLSGQSADAQLLDKEPQPDSPQRRAGATKVLNSHRAIIGGLLAELAEIKKRKLSTKEVHNFILKSGKSISENNVREILSNV